MLLESMSGLSNVTDLGLKEGRDISDHQPHSQDYFERINQLLEEYASEAESTPKMVSEFVGIRRAAVDWAFRHNKVEKIIEELRSLSSHNDPSISKWASVTLDTLNLRSPTSLKVALRAIRAGRTKNLLQALEMELQIAAACCVR
jgi:3-hydroxyisobutyryl-CoA hydrolase